MKNNRQKRIAAAILALIFSVSLPAYASAEDLSDTETASRYHKDEVIYSLLETDGQVNAIYVVNQFEADTPTDITDFGNYASVTNLSDTDALNQQGGSVSFHADKGDFYYQGNLNGQDLPWRFDVSYTLDGVATDASALSGASGFLAMHITTEQNENIPDATFYDNYMLQISVFIPSECASNLSASGATVAVAGQNMSVNFSVMPGTDGDFTLTADIHDFYSDGIRISGMPLSMQFDAFDTDGWIDDLAQLTDAIEELSDGTAELLDGAKTLNSGASSLKSGSANIKSGLSQINQGSAGIKSGSANINTALQQMAAGISGGTGNADFSSLTSLPGGLTQMADALTDISDALRTLDTSFTPAYQALNGVMASAPTADLSDTEVAALYAAATTPELQSSLDTLMAYYAWAKTASSTYTSIQPAFAAVSSTLGPLADNIDTVAANLNGTASSLQSALDSDAFITQITALTDGIIALAANYSAFHTGLVDYTDGVSVIASKYPAFHSGLSKTIYGIDGIADGIGELADGTGTMHDETKDMPQEMQNKIDEMTAVFTGDDFEPVSFVDSRNSAVSLVQFIMMTDDISAPDAVINAIASGDDAEETVWDRLYNLFK